MQYNDKTTDKELCEALVNTMSKMKTKNDFDTLIRKASDKHSVSYIIAKRILERFNYTKLEDLDV